MSDNCGNVPGRRHNWDLWYPVSEQRREDGANPYWYRRTCQTLGCAAIEETAELVPKGKHLFREGYHKVIGAAPGVDGLDKPILNTETVWTDEKVTNR